MRDQSKCRSCGSSIIWAITEKGKRIPLDAEPNVKGNFVIETERREVNGHMEETNRARAVTPLFDAKQTRYFPHHGSCPEGREWRR